MCERGEECGRQKGWEEDIEKDREERMRDEEQRVFVSACGGRARQLRAALMRQRLADSGRGRSTKAAVVARGGEPRPERTEPPSAVRHHAGDAEAVEGRSWVFPSGP